MTDHALPLDEAALRWTDEQAADATIGVLSEDFEVTVLRSWFKPDPKQEKPGQSEWVSRADHARGMLQVGRALLAQQATIAALRRERDEARERSAMDQVYREEAEADLAASQASAARAREALADMIGSGEDHQRWCNGDGVVPCDCGGHEEYEALPHVIRARAILAEQPDREALRQIVRRTAEEAIVGNDPRAREDEYLNERVSRVEAAVLSNAEVTR